MSTADKKRVNIETPVYGSTAMASPAPTDTIPMEPISPQQTLKISRLQNKHPVLHPRM